MRHPLLSVCALVGVLFTSSCLGIGGEPPNISRHSIDLVRMEPVTETPYFPSLAVRSFEGRQRYESRVLRLDADGTLRYLENERWLEDPRDALTDVVREALAGSQAFDVVGPATSEFQGEYMLDGTVLRCDLIASATGPWRARLVIRLDAAHLKSGEMLHAAVYAAERDLPGRSAAGIGPAITECAGEIVEEALEDWRVSSAKENAEPRDAP
jgi:hypothetical protein